VCGTLTFGYERKLVVTDGIGARRNALALAAKHETAMTLFI
jgi:hypothetical protein